MKGTGRDGIMKRGAVLLLITIVGLAFLAWLQGEVLAHGAPGNAYTRLLVWGLGGACLALALLIANRVWTHTERLEQAVQARTAALAQSEQRLREDVARREEVEKALRRSVARAEALERSASRFNEHIERQALLKALCEEAARMLEAQAVAISLYDAEREQFTVAASVGLPAQFAQQAPPLPLSWLRQEVGEARQPVVVNDLEEAKARALSRSLLQAEFGTLVFVEMRYRERLLGLLVVGVLRTRREPDAQDLRLVSGLADQAAQAITNANLFKALGRLLQRTQRQSRQLQRVMEAVPDGLLVLSHEQRLLLANAAGREMLAVLAPEYREGAALKRLGGWDTAALFAECGPGKPWRELRAPQEAAPGGSRAAETAERARVFEVTTRVLGAVEGQEPRIVVLRDVTVDRQRHEAAQSQDRLATVGQMAAGIAHDFNNIMAVITLYSQSLERNPDFPKRREYLATISEQAQQASALIGQILDFSRSESMERGRLDLLPFMKELVKLLQRTLPENISVSLQAEAGKYEISGDPARLRQALLNLALNARDAMPQGGDLQISLTSVDLHAGERAPVRGLAPGRYICLSVADCGEGIAPEVQAHLFEPFYSTKRAGKGTGMGLAQVYGIVKQHGGEILVDSRQGKGSRFTLYIPALRAERPSTRAFPPREPVSAGGATILLVEDHEPTREAIGDTLALMGYNVLAAATGREALALFDAQRQQVDLVLSDMIMPEMGGVELYRQLMARDPNLKMVVMTGYPLEHESRSLLEQGIVAWIRKPFSPDALGEKIGGVLGRG